MASPIWPAFAAALSFNSTALSEIVSAACLADSFMVLPSLEDGAGAGVSLGAGAGAGAGGSMPAAPSAGGLASSPFEHAASRDRKSVCEGKSVSLRVDLGGSWNIKKK